jgi:hypothetical protein
MLVRFGGVDHRAAASLGHRDRHQPDRAAAGDQHGLPRNRPGKNRVHRVAQRIENRAVTLGNRRIKFPDVRRGNLHEFRERAVLIDPDDPQILANVRLAQSALMAMAAVDVHLRADKIAGLDRGNFLAHALHVAAKLMSQRHRRLDPPLRPAIPAVDVQIGPADGRRLHPHEHVRRPDRRHRRGFVGEPARRLHLPQRFHRRGHPAALPWWPPLGGHSSAAHNSPMLAHQ